MPSSPRETAMQSIQMALCYLVFLFFCQAAPCQAIGGGFDSILRNILRQEPDIIMIGKIRDRETAENAVQAALTGRQ